MELDQEKQNQEAAERCRALAQRIVRNWHPQSCRCWRTAACWKRLLAK